MAKDSEYSMCREIKSAALAVLCLFFVCLCWGFTAQSTQWGHVERGQFT